jgi:hypothetical protein
MKTTIPIIFLLLFTVIVSGQDTASPFEKYSYTEFFDLIDQETDSVFKLNDAIIDYNPESDAKYKSRLSFEKDTLNSTKELIIVDKSVVLDNVHFLLNFVTENDKLYLEGSITNIHFTKDVILNNVQSINIDNCKFSGIFRYEFRNAQFQLKEAMPSRPTMITIMHSTFNRFLFWKHGGIANDFDLNAVIRFNSFITNYSATGFDLTVKDFSTIQFTDNYIEVKGLAYFDLQNGTSRIEITNNTITASNILFGLASMSIPMIITGNLFSSKIEMILDELQRHDEVDWAQFEDKIMSQRAFIKYLRKDRGPEVMFYTLDSIEQTQIRAAYIDSVRYCDKDAFVSEISLKGLFYDYYKSKYDTETANEVYLELKDFETKRLEVLYEQGPSFKTFFTWKVNQFLKVFSAYGTEPARAIVFSIYVILCFAFIYLLFPNSWDTLGNRRLMHRFEFFQKYLRRNEGMHTIYLEGKQIEISSFNDFKNELDAAKLELPAFFISWSKPLYTASMFSSNLMARFLKSTDVLSGKWKDLSPKQKRWKNIQIGLLLTLGLFYDLFIKALNALMLSINTFTTLGFGEIPIKGLPRYLAIIQGFIGWFMLTIFSVSLISQLLN